MEFPKPGFNLRKAIDQINAGDDLSWLPNDRVYAVIFRERFEFLGIHEDGARPTDRAHLPKWMLP